MYFMNEWEVQDAEERWRHHPTLGPATMTLSNLMHWTNRNSDGWAYWPKPIRSAARLMSLIEGANRAYRNGHEPIATPAMVRQACAPIKAFLTRQNVDHGLIVEVKTSAVQ